MYEITVAAYADVGVFTSCDQVPWGDGMYLIDPWGKVILDNAFWTRCKGGFTEITQRIAKDFLNATLTWEGDVIEYGFLNDTRPFTVDGSREIGHYAHYDIPMPFGYTQFYTDRFHVRSTSYLRSTSDTSDIRNLGDGVYRRWDQTGTHYQDGDFAFGSPAEDGPVTSYGRFQAINSHNDILKFEGNDIIFNLSSQSTTLRLHWGEGGVQSEGWAWWNGSIWVGKTPVYRSCDDVPRNGKYHIDPTGQGLLDIAFHTQCKDGFTEITQRMAKEFLNARLTWEGDVRHHGFIKDVRPFTIDGAAHYAHYDIPIPFNYTQFYLEDFHIRSMGGESEINYWKKGVYTKWTQKRAGGTVQGDFAFGSAQEAGPVTSYGRFQTIKSKNSVHTFEGNGVVFNVSESSMFRLHWGEAGFGEGWSWWNGSIWVRNTAIAANSLPLRVDACTFELRVEPCLTHTVSDGTGLRCKPCLNGVVPHVSKTGCVSCLSHEVANQTDTLCRLCWEGEIPNTAKNECTPCPRHQVANETETLCKPCLHGSIPAVKRDFCVLCRMPRVANRTDTRCHLCAAGMVPHHQQTHCIPCPPGTFSRPGFVHCQSCGAFAVQPYWGQGDCHVRVTKVQYPHRSVRVKSRKKIHR